MKPQAAPLPTSGVRRRSSLRSDWRIGGRPGVKAWRPPRGLTRPCPDFAAAEVSMASVASVVSVVSVVSMVSVVIIVSRLSMVACHHIAAATKGDETATHWVKADVDGWANATGNTTGGTPRHVLLYRALRHLHRNQLACVDAFSFSAFSFAISSKTRVISLAASDRSTCEGSL
jgi:hypothetical protein